MQEFDKLFFRLSNLSGVRGKATAAIALKQIEEKGYALPYVADSRKLFKVGISFSSETGTVNDFDYLSRE